MADLPPPENSDCEESVFFHEFKHFDEFNSLVDEVVSAVNDIRKEEILINKLSGS